MCRRLGQKYHPYPSKHQCDGGSREKNLFHASCWTTAIVRRCSNPRELDSAVWCSQAQQLCAQRYIERTQILSETQSVISLNHGEGYESEIGVGWSTSEIGVGQSGSEIGVGQDAVQPRDCSLNGEVSDCYAQELEAQCRVMEQLLQQNWAPRPVAEQLNQSCLDCVPECDPVSSTMTLRTWIHKLEQLRAMYNWTESRWFTICKPS